MAHSREITKEHVEHMSKNIDELAQGHLLLKWE
jgi:hypothetical protein